MARTHPDMSYDQILQSLTEQAVAMWGKERAQAVASSLEQTARQLADLGQALPDSDVEPGFYQ